MPRFVTNLPMMYQEYTLLDRFTATVKNGFEGVELFSPYNFDKADICICLDNTGLTRALFNVPPGNRTGGECGIAPLPGREEKFGRGIATVLEYAQMFGSTHLHVMAGLLPVGVDRIRHHTTYVGNVVYTARETAGTDATIVLESINTRDMPGFFLMYQTQAHVVCKEVGVANVKVQFDLYHAQIMEGGLSVKPKQYADDVGHIQVAGVPDCHEPDESEPYYPHLFVLLDVFGYNGQVGCECWPRIGTSEGFGRLRCWCESQR